MIIDPDDKLCEDEQKILCKECASPLVQADHWQRRDRRWGVHIWCPECGFECETNLGPAEAGHLSYAIEGGFVGLLEALAELQDLGTTDDEMNLITRLEAEGIVPKSF